MGVKKKRKKEGDLIHRATPKFTKSQATKHMEYLILAGEKKSPQIFCQHLWGKEKKAAPTSPQIFVNP